MIENSDPKVEIRTQCTFSDSHCNFEKKSHPKSNLHSVLLDLTKLHKSPKNSISPKATYLLGFKKAT